MFVYLLYVVDLYKHMIGRPKSLALQCVVLYAIQIKQHEMLTDFEHAMDKQIR